MLLLGCSWLDCLYWLWDFLLFFLLYNLCFSFINFILVAICLFYFFFIFFIDIFFRVRVISTCRLFYSRFSFCSCSGCWGMLIFIVFMISYRGFSMCSFWIMCFWVMSFVSRMLVLLMARFRSNYFILFTFVLLFWFCLFSLFNIFALLSWTWFNFGNYRLNVFLLLLFLFFFLLFYYIIYIITCFWFSFSAFNILISCWRVLHSCWIFFINLRGFWYCFWIGRLSGRSLPSCSSWWVCRIGFNSRF